MIVIDKADETLQENWSEIDVTTHIKSYMDSGMSKMDAVKAVAKDRKMPKSEVYAFSVDL